MSNPFAQDAWDPFGAAPRGGIYNSQQAQQRELSAQIRLPPLNPKTAAPLKTLAAGLGCLFAGPVGDGGQLLHWSPNESGSTLPPGAHPCPSGDHDSAACAELTPRSIEPAKGRVTALLLAPGPGMLWAGCSDGVVHCWGLCKDGTGTAARWLHSWQAHGGKKIKALALCPTGRLFTGTATGALRMWSYGSPAFAEQAAPRLLRQLCKLDARSGVQLPPHSKVIALAVSAGGRVLWSAGKSTISLWSTHNGECLGTISSDSSEQQQQQQYAQQQYGGYAAMGGMQQQPADINPRIGLDAARLAGQFERPSAELLAADDEAVDAEKDAAAMLINTGVKAMGKASKLLGKLGKNLQEKASKMLDEGRAGSTDLRYDGSATSAYSSSSVSAASSYAPGAAGAAAAPKSADAASKGDIKKLAAAADGSIWVGFKRGVLDKYSEAGQLLWSSTTATAAAAAAGVFRPAGITALAAVGSSVWAGDNQGQLWVLDARSAALQRSWKGHVFPVRSIAAGGHLVYSLGKAGSIRAWPALPPPPALTAAWQQDLVECLKEQQLTVLVGTWNVNETKPSRPGLQQWLAERAISAQLVMIGLQEVEMGTMSVGKDAITQYLAKSKAESATAAAQAWVAMIGEVLRGVGDFRRVGLRQMSGVLVLVFARAELEPHIGEVATASVACGVMGYGGNKGAVAVSFSLFRRRVVIVSSHFAAHQDKVESRNADYAKIVRHLHFHNVPTDKPQQQQQYEASDVVVLGADPCADPNSSNSSSRRLGGGSPGISPRKTPRGGANADAGGSGGGAAAAAADEEWGAGMRDAELLVWVGDFNYRVDRPDGFVPDESDPENNPIGAQLYQYVHRKISAKQHLALLSGDQCLREVARGAIFHGLAEGPISFLPTYKFEKGRESNALQPFYDQGEKKRVPAWTDRVLFRGSGPQRSALECNAVEQRSDVRVCLAGPQAYNSLMESCSTGGALPTWLEVSPAAGVVGPGGCVAIRVQGTKAAQWQAAGGLRCELCVLGCVEGSVDSSRWPVACYRDAPQVHVALP
ncbi:hypothetical protein OEZ85_012390 [Tetradesmus obliquus]|uniref:Inositol polyphosphate-related phosphatase domain-containing protein n=1 Tax=Tetradesmus obliquus TaxID=3088 RepID=A0ABY8TT82_TETOB|nr:hypothetical protein OEZ85_012390 [Tetradesmus obliquus]